MRFVMIRKNYDDKEMILDVLKSLLGASIKCEEDEDYLICYHSYCNPIDITNVLKALEDGLMFSVLAYNSMDLDSLKLQRELAIAKSLLDDLSFNVYDLKSALLVKNYIQNKREILDFILESTGINEQFIKGFINSDLNVSQASKAMYVHRNTMIYKLDKLKDISGFDLRKFQDAYLLYMLIESK